MQQHPRLKIRASVIAVLSALPLLFSAPARGADTDNVTINGTTASSSADVYTGSEPTDPIGGASAGVIVKGKGAGPASGNTVVVTGDVTTHSVAGGGALTSGDADGNKVTVNDGVKVGATGTPGTGSVVGGMTTNGNARGNEVILRPGAEVFKDVAGGISGSGGNANNNIVRIYSSTVDGRVFGGAANIEFTSGGGVILTTTKYLLKARAQSRILSSAVTPKTAMLRVTPSR
jgi:hypothetical protein